MTRRSGLYLAEIRQPKLEEGISLDMEIKCTIMQLKNSGERLIMTHQILQKLLNYTSGGQNSLRRLMRAS